MQGRKREAVCLSGGAALGSRKGKALGSGRGLDGAGCREKCGLPVVLGLPVSCIVPVPAAKLTRWLFALNSTVSKMSTFIITNLCRYKPNIHCKSDEWGSFRRSV